MHYTHHFRIIRRRKHTLPITLIVLAIILTLIFAFGFTKVDAFQFFIGFFYSFSRVLVAYVLALIVAVSLALIVTINKTFEDLALPTLDVLQSFPAFSILPLLMAFFGKNDLVAIFILFIEMIWPILFSVLSGIKGESEEIMEAASIFGATGWKRVIFVTIPSIFPSLTTGSIVAWGEAWETVLAAEIIINIPGVGTYLQQTGTDNSSFLTIGILMLLAVLFIINKLVWIPLLNRSTKYQQ